MSRPWESKLCISLILVFCTILETALRSNPTTFAIFSWVQPLQKDGGQAKRLKRMIMMFRLALWRALISEIQELIVCCITPNFCARASSVQVHYGSDTAISRAICLLSLKGGVRAEIAQLFKNNPLFRPFIILDLYLQHMESLTEITGRQAISTRTSPFTHMRCGVG